jgi:6-phosphogluconolactonase (cycloisomerase 2 family)
MSTRFAWLLGLTALVLIALLVACSSTYNSSQDGLLIVGSQGSSVLESYSFSLASGRVATVSNPPIDTANETCLLPGNPTSIVVDPTGAHAYVIVSGNTVCPPGTSTTPGPDGIQAFQINSDGTLASSGNLISLNSATVQVCINNTLVTEPGVPVVPVFLAMDSAGKYLFVADSATTDKNGNPAPGAVSVFAVNNGTLTEVPSSPFTVPASCVVPANNLTALAPSPTVFPPLVNGVQNAVCSNTNPPTSEYLYVADSTFIGEVWEFEVNTSTGALGLPGNYTTIPSFATGQVPSGVTVDPCNRFVYVSNQGTSNNISAFSICNGTTTQSALCPPANVLPHGDGSLQAISGSPFSNIGSATNPGPLLVDAYGNFLYVLNVNASNVAAGLNGQISPYRISPTTGSLTALSLAPIATGHGATAIAIRSDDSWLFVTNYGDATVSQYSVTPATGALAGVAPVQTDNEPFGVAVK